MDIREIVNRNALTTLLLRDGFNVYLPMIDHGIDMIAHREADGRHLLIQQKSRWTIDRRYIGRDIHLAFPVGERWFLVPHDEMLDWPQTETARQSSSWIDGGSYHSASPRRDLVEALAPFALGPDPAETAAMR